MRTEDMESSNKYALISTPQCVYKADITNSGKGLVNNYLAVRNRRTNQMTLIPVHEANFKHSAFDNKQSLFENNIVDAKKVMTKEFGGKKALANFERIKKSQPNIEVLEDALKKQLNNIEDDKIFDEDLMTSDKNQFSIFPEIDLSGGKSVKEIFKVDKLIGDQILEMLSETSLEVLSMDQRKLKLANNYLTSSVKAIQTTRQPDSSENIKKVSLFLYIDALVRLINNRQKNWDQLICSPFSKQLALEIRSKFNHQGNSANSKATKQKCTILYIILMLMSTDVQEIDIDSVLDEVDLTRSDLIKYAQVLGARVRGGTTLYIQKVNLDKNSQINVPMPSGKRKRKAQ